MADTRERREKAQAHLNALLECVGNHDYGEVLHRLSQEDISDAGLVAVS